MSKVGRGKGSRFYMFQFTPKCGLPLAPTRYGIRIHWQYPHLSLAALEFQEMLALGNENEQTRRVSPLHIPRLVQCIVIIQGPYSVPRQVIVSTKLFLLIYPTAALTTCTVAVFKRESSLVTKLVSKQDKHPHSTIPLSYPTPPSH